MKGYVCDQCKNIVGRFDRVNPDTIRLQVHRPGVDIEKTEAHFCDWTCLSAFVQRQLECRAECERNTRMMAQKYLDGQPEAQP